MLYSFDYSFFTLSDFLLRINKSGYREGDDKVPLSRQGIRKHHTTIVSIRPQSNYHQVYQESDTSAVDLLSYPGQTRQKMINFNFFH